MGISTLVKKGFVLVLFVLGLAGGSFLMATSVADAATILTQTLSLGSTGSEVSELQTFLQAKGFYTYPSITAYFGPVTQSAVEAYQRSVGIEAIGIVGPQTRAAIGSDAEGPGISSPSVSTTPIAFALTQTLSLGSTGEQVIVLQNLLISDGFSIPAGATGYFGSQTEAAVEAYQRARGIEAIGIVGPLTRASINASITTTTTITTSSTGTTSASTPPTIISGGGGGGGGYYTSTPVISAISAGSIGNTSATITWTTDQAATSEVNYGTTSSYGDSTPLDSTYVTSHSVVLSGLTPGTLYHFEVVSANSVGQSITSSDQIFTTTTTADTVPPSVALTAPVGGTTITGTAVSLSASASDNVAVAQVTFILDGTTNIGIATTSPYNATWNSKLAADGVHTIEAVAEDTSGNYATTTPVSITIDNTAPVRSAGAPSGTLAVNTTSTTLSLTTNENATCKYSTTAGSAYSGMTPFTTTGGTSHSTPISGLTNNGSYSYYVKCSDTVGNTNGSDYAISFTVSAGSGPTVIVTVPTNNTKLGGSAVSLTATATDTVPVSTVQFFLVGTTTSAISSSLSSAPYTTTWNSTSVPDGVYSIVAVAHDSASLSATSSSIAITVDNTAPVLSAGSPTGTLAFGTTETTLSVVTNERAICKYSTTPGTAYSAMTVFTNTGNTTHSSTISGLTNGSSYTYYVKCMDTVGNTDASDYTFSFSVAADTVPPSVEIISPIAGATLSGVNISLVASSTDNVAVAGVQFFLDGAQVTSVVTSSTTLFSANLNSTSVSNGTHSLVAVSEDTSNNYATSSAVSVTVDNTAPSISSLATSTTPTTATISWTTNKAATTVLNYGPTTSYGTSSSSPALATSHLISLTGLTVSTTYHFQIVSTDQYGNTGTSTDQTFTTPAAPDTTAPLVSVTAPSSGATVSGSSVALTASSTDNVAVAGVTFYLDGTKYGSELTSSTTQFSTSWDSTATSSGSHVVFAVSRDTSNNFATSTPVSFTVTNAGPTISAIASSTTQTSASITWTTGTNANSLINYGPTSSYGSASSTAALATSHIIILSGLTAGTTYHFQISSTDAFSNTSTSSDLTFTTASIPVTAPTVTAQSASSIGTTTATLNGTITSNNNASSTVEGFNYGLTTSYGSTASSTGTFNIGAFTQALTGLTSGTTYHYQAFAVNTAGIGTSTDQTFTTVTVAPPTITTQAATNIASSSVTFNGTIVADNNASTTVRGFVYGLTTAYTASTTNMSIFGLGTFATTSPTLTASTTYHYAAYGTNSAGTGYGADQVFTTATTSAADITPPIVAITAPTASSTVSGIVTLTASSTDNIAVAGVTFYINGTMIGSELTSSTTIFSTTWDSTATSSGSYSIIAVSRDTSNNYATSTPISFTVANGSAPVISNVSPGIPTNNAATITWTTDASSTSYVNYGLNTLYGSASSTATLVTSHSITITGLTASTTYDFIVSSTAAGLTSTSSNMTFTTTPILNPQIMVFGDSRTSNGGGIGPHTASAGYTDTMKPSLNYVGCVPLETNNSIYYASDWNFGVGAQSTAGFVSRYSTASFATSGGTANNYVGTGGLITSTDNEFNIETTGQYSSLTDPSNVLLFLGGVNDGNIGPTGTTTYQKQSMINIATLLTAWRTAGKVVFLANELPTGVGTAHRESYTIPAGGGTYTTLNASKYANDLYVSYTPAPGGANDGVKLTKVSSAPGAGQYSVSGGAYTFSAADGGATVAIDYTYNYYNNTGTGLIAKIALHNWLSSSAANFVDPSSGIDYGIPGALYNRSWVVPVDTWDTIADPTQASLALNLPNTLSDGLHPTDYGCQLIAKSFATALSSRLPQTDYSGLPTGESELVVTSNGVKTLYTSSDTSPLAHAFNRLPITPGTFTIQVGTTTVTDNGSGALSGTGVITASSTINYSTGAWSLGFTTAAKPAVSVKFIASTDPSTLITNGLLIPANGFSPVTSLSGCTGLCATSGNLTSSNNTGIPTGYIDSIDSGSSAGLGSGALKMDFALSTTTSDGYPELAVKVYGQTATSTSLSIGSGTTGATIQPNQKYRATAVVKIDAGPNGHLYGLTAVQLGVICTAGAGTSFTPAGETAVFSNGASSPIYTGRSWAAGTGVAFSDADVASGELRIPILSQSCDTTGMSGNLTGSISLSILGDPNTPISATIHISRLSLKPYSY